MKRFRIQLAVLFIAITAVFFTSCTKNEFDTPPIIIPDVQFEANTTIAELKASYTGLQEITEDVIIKGVITANDKSGNLYKKMIIQDETGAIELAIDQTNLSSLYKVGQMLYVKCKGLYLGDYNNLIQIGYLYQGSVGRMPQIMIEDHIFRDSLPGAKPVADTVTISSIGEAAVDNPYVSKLVTFKNVTFAEQGELYASQDVDAINRTLMDLTGKSMIVRNSKYADFANDSIPYGYGTVTGILSIFGSDWQLTLRDVSDVINFSDSMPPAPGSGDGTFESPFNIERAMMSTSPDAVWVKGYIVGVYETGGTEFVPRFDGPFETASNFLIAASPDETVITNCMPVQLPSGAIRDALNLVDNADNDSKEVMVLGTLQSYFSMPGIKELTGYWLDGNGVVPATGFFTEEFNQTIGSFTQYSVLGDQVWVGQDYDDGCVTMSGYVNPNRFANEDWLISPAISLAGKTGVKMIFREAMNYAGNINNEAKVFISTNYSGSGDPNEADWTELTGFSRSAGDSWGFVNTSEIDLTAYEGQNIFVGFKYTSTTSVAGTWEISRVVISASN